MKTSQRIYRGRKITVVIIIIVIIIQLLLLLIVVVVVIIVASWDSFWRRKNVICWSLVLTAR